MNLNYLAPCNELGYGHVGRNLLVALDRAGVEVSFWPIGPIEAPVEHHDTLRRCIGRAESFSVTSPSLRCYHQFSLAEHVGKGLHCALPIFELTRFRPVERHHLLAQDVVFAPSRWAAEVLMDNGVPPERVARTQFGVDRCVFPPGKEDTEYRVATKTVFLNCGKWELRKGHDILVDAFNEAFEPSDDVELVMNCFNPCFQSEEQMRRYNQEWVNCYKSSPLGSKISIIKQRLKSQSDVAHLMSLADCGVFPSRGEGWNLEAAEMLAIGKHVILTDYAAHQEYATRENSLLIDVTSLEDAHDGVWFDADHPSWHGKPGQWAAFHRRTREQIVEHMRSIHKRKQEGTLRLNVAGIESMQRFTWDNTARDIMAVLQ